VTDRLGSAEGMAMDKTLASVLFPGDSEMARRMREFEWAKTPIGPVESWSPTLRTTVRMLLVNRFPLLLWWGPHYIQLYNDAYRPIPGAKHPKSLGQPARECWPEIWHVIGPLIDTPFRGGPATWMEDIFLEVNRHGFMEETHFTIAYSPVPDEAAPGGIGGVLGTVHEITEKVVGERRMGVLRDLGSRPAEAKTAEEACIVAAKTLAAHSKDVPFALLYLTDADGRHARLAGTAGAPVEGAISPQVVDLDSKSNSPWPLVEAKRTEQLQIVSDLGSRFPAVPSGPWSDPPHTAVVLPIRSNREHALAGFLIAGISARLCFDDAYRGFLELATAQIAIAIANARAFEAERERAEKLAELDRAKTLFFTNVSHEFRTPLTLLLGPVEDMLAKPEGAILPENRVTLRVVHRNGLRLLKLVNTLLDFSRIEAGRMQAVYQRTDIAALTSELASMFRSAVEKAGMPLLVDCPPIDAPVYLDREMWEKIVLNLLSNAFKFTFAGEIEVRLRQVGESVELIVRDTGVGIPAKDLPHVCERFYRVEGARSRSHEGTGIGLALACELVKLHGGAVRVESVEGQGTTFTVSLPLGSAHLPPDRIDAARSQSSTSLAPNLYVEEAQRWLPSEKDEGGRIKDQPINGLSLPPSSFRLHPSEQRPRIVLADDNADMREYVRRLLSQRYDVEAAPDGAAALESVNRQPPDLVLADVMMPQLDGFALLRALRADAKTHTIPVILLSARAGEEARVEGLGQGADDYLVKPFSARELLARVDSHLGLARLRREADRRKDEFLATLAHELRNPLAPIRNAVQIMRLAASNQEVTEQARQTIERQLAQLVRLVDDLLDLSRITRNKIDLRKERVVLASIIQSAVEISLPLIEASAHELKVALPPQTVWLNADLTRMAQVVANLLNNAAKYTPERGRIWLTAELTSRERERPEAVIRVRDSGIGIPPDMLPHIFEMFAQVETSRDRAQGGLGIGLTLVKSLVEMHGGSVQATSAGPGQGSEFTVRLPIASQVPTTGAAGRAHEEEADKKVPARRILVVDDNRDSAESLGLLLQMMGNEVRIAHDGRSALEEAGAFRPDFALVDIGMPGMSGYEVAQRLRERPELRGVVLIALTGWGQEEDYRRSYEAGFHHHLTKPTDLAALKKLLTSLP
jgi:signal transduction histidine kinase